MKYQDWRAGRLLIGLLCILSFCIVVAGFLYYRAFKQHEWADVETQLHAIADLKKQDLAQWRDERMSDGEYFRDNPYLSVLVRQVLDAPQNVSLRNQMQSWLSIIKNHSTQYDRISILNVSGEEISSAPNTPAIPSLVIRQNILSAAKSGKTEFVDFYQNEQDQKIYLAILVPIHGFDANKVPAFLMLRIDPQLYLYPYIRRWPTRHSTSETLLVRHEGSDALYLNGLKYRPKMDLKYRVPLSMKDRPAVKAVLGQSGFVVGRDYRDVAVVADVLAIPNSPWFLVARIDAAEAFAPVRARFWEIIISAGVLLGITWLGWGFFWKRQGTQYYREKAEASESLRELNEYLEITLKSIGDGVVVTDAAGLVTGLNPMAESLTGWLMPEAVGHSLTEVFPIINARTRQSVENPIEKVLKTGGLVGLANHTVLISRNGVERQIADSAAPIRDAAGRIRGVVLVFRDVTEEYEAAAALERHRLELKAVYDHAPVMMCAIDASRHILNANHVFSEFAGKQPDLFTGNPVCSVLGCVHASENSRESVSGSACVSCPLSQAIEETFRTGTAQRDIEYHASIVRNGERKEVAILCATALVSAAEQSYLLLYLSDITNSKRIEEKLRASEELHRKLIEALPDVVIVTDLDERITYCSAQGLVLFGVDRVEDYYGTLLDQWLIPEDRELLRLNIANSLQGVFVLQNRYTAAKKEGSHFVVEINTAPIAGPDGQPAGLVAVLRDVTHHVRALDSLRESEERFRALFNSMEEGVALHKIIEDAEGNAVDYSILDYNPAYVKHTGMSPNRGVPASIVYRTGYPPYLKEYGRAAKEGHPYRFEAFFAPLNRYFHISVVSAGPGRFSTVFEDITERKLSESQLRKSMEKLQHSVREKEALLREIHHRVKNNLQVISSLLSLESARIDNPGTKMTLREMQNRIRSMALLHETIYSSENLAKIDLSVYFERLCRHLIHSLLAHPEFIQLEFQIAPVFLDVSQAVPCGLFVNELVSNSLKHAFPNDRPGVIHVEVTSLNEGSCLCVCVADNGIGLPEDFEQKRSHSLGLQLVSDLAGQLGGKLEITSNPGASFAVTFKPKTESQLELHNE